MTNTTPSSAGDLETRSATPEEQKMINDILNLYQCNPTHQAYSHYAENAVFHDPVSIAKGKESIQSQFNGMPKIFARSETEHIAVLRTSTPTSLQLNLTQNYIFKSPIPLKKEGTSRTVNSKITLNKNKQGLIEEHIEEWDHERNKTADDGFVGKLMEGRKKIDAKIVEKSVSGDPGDV
ncbi:hypothetical protein BDV97DRAFT_307986 [Delphinella strobiligena]|nr:hypothetical protein BDV97DRAFT_307986 [Delphinella strobiligena]